MIMCTFAFFNKKYNYFNQKILFTIKIGLKLKKMILLICTNFFTFLLSAHGFWWPFSSYTDSSEFISDPNSGSSSKSVTAVSTMFAPFEISHGEQKFLAEAKHYLENLSMLDQCNLLIVNRLKSTCSKLSEEDLSKLGVNLLNCQSAVEGRKVFPCNDDMKLLDCTKDMDADMWNSYHIISNRARAICHNMRQAEFRMKTEQTVNNMAAATLENVNILQSLASGQKKLQITTEEAVDQITKNHELLVSKQNEFKRKQDELGNEINSNIVALTKEKQIIAHRHQQIEEYTERINEQLDALVEEIKAQDLAKKESDRDILKDLDFVKSKADEVLKKLESVFVDIDHYQENFEAKQNKTLENLEEIQAAIGFMNEVLNKLCTSFNNQVPWLQTMFGGTIDKLNLVTVLFSHCAFFVFSILSVLFIGVPTITKVSLLLIVPLNCLVAVQQRQHLSFLQMSWFLLFTFPFDYVIKKINFCTHSKSLIKNEEINQPVKDACKSTYAAKSIVYDSETNVSFREALKKSQDDFCNGSQTMHQEAFIPMVKPMDNSFEISKNDLFKTFKKPFDDSFNISPSSTSSPLRLRHAQTKANSSFLNITAGGSPRCCSLTKSGMRCKNAAILNEDNCRLHSK
ncbi:protein brambleberry isoform X5 [Hydra vulgaris]|uniref:Protein brambleberry isoform X5 n=1 Tax=Hydra vulgaris TaxID=6087 RepID=A0ABM4CYL4_HYDVU